MEILFETACDWVKRNADILNIYIWNLANFIVKNPHIITHIIYVLETYNDIKFSHAHEHSHWVVFCEYLDEWSDA